MNAMTNGWHIFEDCLGVCRFNMTAPELVIEAVNAATDAHLSVADGVKIGKRIVNLLRMFNFKNGLTREVEAPSPRYGSSPVDGPAKGLSTLPHWKVVQELYYRAMGWDPVTGKPTQETLSELGLDDLMR